MFYSAFQKYQSNIKHTWSLINSLLPKGVDKCQISITVHNVLITQEVDVANHFNEFFNKVSDNLDGYLPPDYNSDPLSNIPRLPTSMQLFPVSREELLTHILPMRKSKNYSKNSIFVDIYKLAALYFFDILCSVINEAFQIGVFPQQLKHTNIKPVFKRGDK